MDTTRDEPRQTYLERMAAQFEPVTEAAAVLGVSRQRVLQLIRGGDLEAVKIGREWFVGAVSLQERLARQRPRPDVQKAAPSLSAGTPGGGYTA